MSALARVVSTCRPVVAAHPPTTVIDTSRDRIRREGGFIGPRPYRRGGALATRTGRFCENGHRARANVFVFPCPTDSFSHPQLRRTGPADRSFLDTGGGEHSPPPGSSLAR